MQRKSETNELMGANRPSGELSASIGRRTGHFALHVAAVHLAVAMIGGGGCTHRVPVTPSPFDEDDPRASRPAAGIAADSATGIRENAQGATPRPHQKLHNAVIARERLQSVLEQGPGRFLRGVELTPEFRDGNFAGWQIVQFMPGETRFDDYDLRPGDVIGPINGRLIARPPHLAALWSELHSADVIVVEVTRDGETFELRLEVAGSSPASGDDVPTDATP